MSTLSMQAEIKELKESLETALDDLAELRKQVDNMSKQKKGAK
jgi:hypothetical protein